MSTPIYTIGHSTLPLPAFLELLAGSGIERVADVRRHPGSRRHPHFSSEALQDALRAVGIEWEHFEALGGRRTPTPDSPNTFWENPQFRGYADHMGSAEFREAVTRLLESERTTAVMCAEAVPWRCHRNLLSDDLVRRGVEVRHIIGAGPLRAHTPAASALFEEHRVIYPAAQSAMFGGRV